MDPISIINKYYQTDSIAYEILLSHSHNVSQKAMDIANSHPALFRKKDFIMEAAMLHDIGIFLTDAPGIGCHGKKPYICHGYLGAEILRKEGLPQHALVCERHTGTGISKKEIIEKELPIPQRDMIPITLEEQLICYADKFFSKSDLEYEKNIDEIRDELALFGEESLNRFNSWVKLFG